MAHSEHGGGELPERPSQWLTLSSHGALLGVWANDPAALGGVERMLPFGSRIEASGDGVDPPQRLDYVFALLTGDAGEAASERHRLFRDSSLLEASCDLAVLHERLESELHFSVASHARTALFVHAGVVGWRERAILVPGRSMSGKTSLVAAFLRAGADYYSDEYAVVDERGRIHPYPRPLGVRAANGAVRKVAPESLGCRVGSAPLRAGLIVATRYSAGTRYEPTVRGAARGLMSLIGNTVVVRERSSFALDRLELSALGATTLEGPRGDADEAVAWVLRYLDAADARAES